MRRNNRVAIVVCLLIVGSPTMVTWGLAADDPPKETADQRFEKLSGEAMKAPEKANWKALREAFAETSHYEPYNIEVTEKLKEISKSIGRVETKESEAALLKLLERERSMRFDTVAMLLMLYRRTDQPEKAKKYEPILGGILGALNYPKAGTSFDNAIEVLFIQEEYLVTTKMPIKGRSTAGHDGHRFDVFEIEADGAEKAKKLYFNIDLPYKALLKSLEN